MSLANGMKVPGLFEDYLHMLCMEPAPARSKCEGCGRTDLRSWSEPTVIKDKPMIRCEACLRYAHGYDQAEESLVRSILGAAVTAALEADTARDLVRGAVTRALDADLAREAIEEGRWAGRMEVGAR